jgi:peroxiredoxin
MTAFRSHTDRFVEANAQVLGVSTDQPAAAGEFEAKLGLEFPLLSDWPRNQVGRDFGVYNEERFVHSRTTVIIDKEGIVRDVYTEGRDFESHPVKALEILAAMNA